MSGSITILPPHSVSDGSLSLNEFDQHILEDLEMPNNKTAWLESEEGSPFDLSVLWQVLESHKLEMKEKAAAGQNINTTWELVVVQGVLLTLLVLVFICWAVGCRKRCFRPNNPSVADALKKLSNTQNKSLPSSYSNPTPEYSEDNLQYLDLEAGHRRLSRLSFGSSDGVLARLGRLSVASCESCSSESVAEAPFRGGFSASTDSSSSSRRESRTSTNSRISFSEDVECSTGSIRRLSSNTIFNLGANSSSSSRKSSTSSEGSRRSSLGYKVNRKMGSNNQDSFNASLDEELREKLDSIGEQEDLAELQTERGVRVCDIITKGKLFI